ncbi:hypothetical protein [Streptomyces chartreusis]|uniref:hypothetical protein n=1 Tax=Streptomyces chartreusis TaxID=1969 RepID=UPI00380C12AA
MIRDLVAALNRMPTRPPFMETCQECGNLLDDLVKAWVHAANNPLYDGALRVQIVLARHLAVEHTEALPEPHSDGCEACARFEQHRSPDVFWREHLARGLFLPTELARLM